MGEQGGSRNVKGIPLGITINVYFSKLLFFIVANDGLGYGGGRNAF